MRLLRAITFSFLLSFALTLSGYQVAMNTWAASNFTDGDIVMTLTGAWKAAGAENAFDPAGAPWGLTNVNARRQGVAISSGNTTVTEFGWGCDPQQSGSVGTGSPDAQNAMFTQYSTTATPNTNIGVACNNTILRVGRSIHTQYGLSLNASTDIRVFVGVTDQTKATMSAADDPAGNYAGFRFSAGTDTNWTCVTKDNTTQDTDDSGVLFALDTGYEMEVSEASAGVWNFYINDALVCTMSTNPPTSGTLVRPMATAENTTGNNKIMRYWWMYMDSLL